MNQNLNVTLELTREEKQRKEYEEKERNERIQIATMIVNALEDNLKRQHLYKDPVTRNSVFLEKLLCILDIFKGAMHTYFNDVPDELHNRMTNIVTLLNTNMTSLIEMIQQPCYSPDHPYGREVMKTAQNDFKEKSEGSF